jgi:hypothetical protein
VEIWGAGNTQNPSLDFFAVVNGQTLQQQRSQTGAGASSDSVEHHEALQSCAVIRKLADAVQGEIHDLFANGVVASSVVVRGVFFARDQLLRVEEGTEFSGAHLVDHRWLQVQIHASRNMLAGTSLREERVECIVSVSNGLVRGHLAVNVDAVFQAVELPASVSDLHSALANVNGNDFAHFFSKKL